MKFLHCLIFLLAINLVGCTLVHRAPNFFTFRVTVPAGTMIAGRDVTWILERQFPLTDDERRTGTLPHAFLPVGTFTPTTITPLSDNSFTSIFVQPVTGPTGFNSMAANYRVRCRAYVGPPEAPVFIGEATSNQVFIDVGGSAFQTTFQIDAPQGSPSLQISARDDLNQFTHP